MKVFLSPTIALHSPAMVRIANALTKYIPPHYQIVTKREEADLCVFYPVSYEWIHYLKECESRGQEYALVQCCYKTSGGTFDMWRPWWDKAIIVWSYLNLVEPQKFEVTTHNDTKKRYLEQIVTDFNFYEAPLGIDEPFTLPCVTHPKRDYIVTTGTVHGGGQEAILECWEAARKCDLNIVHVGQFPEGIQKVEWFGRLLGCAQIVHGCTDRTLRGIYQNAKYVCSLRYVEGFELPALEALSCGTRSIVFIQPATTKWFFDYCEFVPECEGEELVKHLVRKFSAPYESISQHTIDGLRARFNWGVLCWRFWTIVDEEMSMRQQAKRIAT